MASLENDIIYRSLPYNIQAEQLLLGALLINNDHLNKVIDFLTEEHFFEPLHQRIFQSIITYNDKGLVANPVTLKNKFEHDEALKALGDNEYLAKLAGLATTIINVHDYARTVFDLALRRNLVTIGENIVNNAYNSVLDLSSAEQIEQAEHDLYKLAKEGSSHNKGFKPLSTGLLEAVNKAQLAYKNKEKVTGISSGFVDIDNILGGFHNSDLLILAGRPSMGKTAFAVNLAINSSLALVKNHKDANTSPPSVGIFSLEMSSEQLATRMLAIMAAVNASKIRNGLLSEDEFSNILTANKTLYQLPIYLDDTPSLSITALRARARRLKRKHNLAIIFVDYLQLLRGASIRSNESNRVQEISEITQSLKAIAKELEVPVVALSQLSRAVEQRDDKRPLLADLRESGSIEQDADIVMFIYREEYYLIRKQPPEGTDKHIKWQEEMNKAMNVAEIIVAKHRNGPVGQVKLYFDSMTTKFTNLAQYGF